MSSRLGIDVGGTFTDLLLFDERSGAMRLLKTPSTPSDQSVGILNGIQQLIEETGVAATDISTLTGAALGLLALLNREWSMAISVAYVMGCQALSGIAKDLTGNYQRGLLTLSVPMLAAAGIMFYMRQQSLRSPDSKLMAASS